MILGSFCCRGRLTTVIDDPELCNLMRVRTVQHFVLFMNYQTYTYYVICLKKLAKFTKHSSSLKMENLQNALSTWSN